METNTSTLQSLVDVKSDFVREHGAWHSHNIHLQGDLYTMAPEIIGDEVKLRRITQCVFDLAGGSVDGLRVIDLASGEGIYGIELARHGANVVSIEGRETNIEKGRFVKRALSLGNLEFVQDDVRNVTIEKYGLFDVVLCLGILYHLDAPDVFKFAEQLGNICKRICIVDTRITFHPKTELTYNGQPYHGAWGEEHWPGDSKDSKLRRLGASLDNDRNFWLSRATLYNLLSHAGFTSVYECNIPAEPQKPANRLTFVAIKGAPCRLLNSPLMAGQPAGKMPERPVPENSAAFDLARTVSHVLPKRVRKLGRKALGLENPLT